MRLNREPAGAVCKVARQVLAGVDADYFRRGCVVEKAVLSKTLLRIQISLIPGTILKTQVRAHVICLLKSLGFIVIESPKKWPLESHEKSHN